MIRDILMALGLVSMVNAFALSEIITSSGSQLEINYDPGTKQVVFRAVLEPEIWFGIGFGIEEKPRVAHPSIEILAVK